MKKIKLPRTFFPTDEELKKMKKERDKEHQKTPENMSYWFPKLEALKNNSVLQLPKTKIIPLPFEWWEWLRTDHYSDEMIEKFQQFILEEVGSFEKGKKLFLKLVYLVLNLLSASPSAMKTEKRLQINFQVSFIIHYYLVQIQQQN